jgi:hypothetical protein
MWQALSIWLLLYPLSSPYKEDVFYLGRNHVKPSSTLGLRTLISDYSLFTLCKPIMNLYAVVISENMNNNRTIKQNIINLCTLLSLTFNYK